ncbi:hypothetical protein PanWU01x14_000010 [Parasponia andersonii]|uniref:Transmembrane protein n=1 Tax=Parasponia andersonii TaxID=3476 RepID=A0A2P5E4I4_PARAD|nr:hypothetical protein PanWU01x14_000010 [Parasponia andersonii]
MARLGLFGLILAGILVVQVVADKSKVSEPNPVEVSKVESGVVSKVADQPVSSATERSEGQEESREAEAPGIRRLGKHDHHSDRSVAGGGVIIGGLVTAVFAAVFCYIRVTRKRNSVL